LIEINARREAEPLAGFEEWSGAVRFLLMWLGMTDPVRSMEGARAQDPNRSELTARVDVCRKYFGTTKEFTAADIVKLGSEPDVSSAGIRGFKRLDLFDAFSRDGRGLNAKMIGHQLVKDQQRRVGDYYITLAQKNDKTSNTYRVAGPEGVEPEPQIDPFSRGQDPKKGQCET
jgi:hypothetical protein